MITKILKVLKEYFPQYNDYKLSKIAWDIYNNIKSEQIEKTKFCISCMYYNTLPITYVGESSNLCQKGRERGNAEECPYYCKSLIQEWEEKTSHK